MKKSEARKEYLQEVGELSFKVKERRSNKPLKNTLYNYEPPRSTITSYACLIKAGFTIEEAIKFING